MPSKKCEAEGCAKWASFNLPGMKRPQYCRPHALPGMVNVVSRQRCNFNGCTKQANFNSPGESRGLYCKAHIEPGMVDVRHKHCQHPGCSKQATCNYNGQPTGAYCGQHKLQDMVNVVLKRCQQEGCEVFPSFGVPGQPGVQYCRSHKLPGMVRRTAPNAGGRQQDIDHLQIDPTRCAHPGCGDCRPIYCFNHYQAHQQDPLAHQQMEEAQMQQYAEMQMHHQQLQSQEVHGGEHLQPEDSQQHILGHQIAMEPHEQLHHSMPENASVAAYATYGNGWPQQGIPHEHELTPEDYQRALARHALEAARHYTDENGIARMARVDSDQQHVAYNLPAQSESLDAPPSAYSPEGVRSVESDHHGLQAQAMHQM